MAGNVVRIPNTIQLGNLTRGNAISQHQISSDFGSTDWRWPSPSQKDPPWLAPRQIMAAVEVQVLSLGFPQMNFSSLLCRFPYSEYSYFVMVSNVFRFDHIFKHHISNMFLCRVKRDWLNKADGSKWTLLIVQTWKRLKINRNLEIGSNLLVFKEVWKLNQC